MPSFFRRIGFEKVKVSVGGNVFEGKDMREFIANRGLAQLSDGDPMKKSWLDAGITEEEIEETIQAVKVWRDTEDAWFTGIQCEMLGWK
jgi:hypothetical protein